jgi:hypothetical protein
VTTGGSADSEAYGVSINRVAEVLAEMGLLLDDRVPAFDTWLEDKLTDLAPGIAADVRDWAQVLRHGGPRSQPRNINTVRRYLRAAHPVLVEWSTRYDHLREVKYRSAGITSRDRGSHLHLGQNPRSNFGYAPSIGTSSFLIFRSRGLFRRLPASGGLRVAATVKVIVRVRSLTALWD